MRISVLLHELQRKGKLCYIDSDSYIISIKTKYIYVDITKDIETRFDTSNYKLERPLP